MNFGILTVKFNQWLSFNVLGKHSHCETVFWPGCAVLKMDFSTVETGFLLMQKSIPEIGFSALCCGKPTFAVLDKKDQEKRIKQLKKQFSKNGTKTVYTLCPNCSSTLKKQFPQLNVCSAWDIIAEHTEKSESNNLLNQDYYLHDPCGDRKDSQSQSAVRKIAAVKGVAVKEFQSNRERTLCCGRKDMLFLTNPEASDKMLLNRITEAGDQPIITYCESCVEAFRSKGKEAYHILEILNGRKAGRSFWNRFKVKNNIV